MIYNVLLAEDEPAAMRHLRSAIEKRCPGFNVIASAQDGMEALEKLEEYQVDVLITDIRMPRMDGLALAREVKENYPDILTVILSGYQEFEYAQKAIRHSVLQYILKPININDFQTMMKDLSVKLDQSYYWRNYKQLQAFFSSQEEKQDQNCSSKMIHTSILRFNGLHPKFHEKMNHSPSPAIRESLDKLLLTEEKNSLFLYSGRDRNEYYIFCEKENLHYCRFQEIIRGFADSLDESNYYTAVIALDVKITLLSATMKSLFSILRQKTLLEISSIFFERNEVSKQIPSAEIDSILRLKMEYQLYNSGLHRNKELLWEWLEKCRKDKIPLSQIQMEFFQFISHLSTGMPSRNELLLKIESMMDSIFHNITSYKELHERLMTVIGILQDYSVKVPSCIGSEESFNKIKDYIRQHLADDLSVGLICTQFSLSHSYLNKLFHKYEKKCVLEFIKEERVKASIEIMKGSPQLPLKDISRIVGYEDSSYFSRVFKSQTGLSPRQYQEQMN